MEKEWKADQLPVWIEQTQNSSIPKLESFASGLADFLAVLAALTHELSNARLESQINQLKTIKRVMYGRAGFDLLRKWVLHRY